MKTVTEKGKDLHQWLKENGKLEYGSVVTDLEIQNFLGIQYPEKGTHQEFKGLDLLMLSVTDYVRNILLGEGKAFIQSKGDYRILLPSENAKCIERYMSSADKKLKRALKLSRNQPITDSHTDDKTVNIMLKREAILREQQKQQELR